MDVRAGHLRLPRRLALASVVLAASLAASCSLITGGESNLREVYDSARTKWAEQGVRSYTVDMNIACFCPVGGNPVQVQVRDGAVVSVTPLQGGQPVNTSSFGQYPTVDRLFEIIGDAIDRKADRIFTTYDPDRNFPTRIEIDYRRNAIDDEVVYNVANLVPAT
jgi:hypothetical protein